MGRPPWCGARIVLRQAGRRTPLFALVPTFRPRVSEREPTAFRRTLTSVASTGRAASVGPRRAGAGRRPWAPAQLDHDLDPRLDLAERQALRAAMNAGRGRDAHNGAVGQHESDGRVVSTRADRSPCAIGARTGRSRAAHQTWSPGLSACTVVG